MQRPLIKICGISDIETLAATMQAGADFIGFVHFEKSPRHVGVAKLAELIRAVKSPVKSVVVLVNPDEALLDKIFAGAKPDYLQLHGVETPERVREIRKKYGVKIIKAIGMCAAADVTEANAFEGAADIILFDAKAPGGAENAGGFGVSFDWSLLNSLSFKSWMLSGGLSADNVAQALEQTSVPMVDVSSHIETPVGSGKKDISKIREFIRKAKVMV